MLSFEIAVCLKHWIFCVILIFASIPISLMTIAPFTTWHVNKKSCISILYHIVRRQFFLFLKNYGTQNWFYCVSAMKILNVSRNLIHVEDYSKNNLEWCKYPISEYKKYSSFHSWKIDCLIEKSDVPIKSYPFITNTIKPQQVLFDINKTRLLYTHLNNLPKPWIQKTHRFKQF